MKCIAKTRTGTEFLHSRKNAYFAPDASADKIAKIMNDIKYQLANDEKWYVYDYDFTQADYVYRRLSIRKGIVTMRDI